MPENQLKCPQGASPVARAGGGDISEIELTRERYALQTTPPARVQPAHPKKQLFSTPVNKFTAKLTAPSGHLERIKSCLSEVQRPLPAHVTPRRVRKFGPKAISMEDLTPTKRLKTDKCDRILPRVRFTPRSVAEEQAAVIIGRFMLVHAWRRRRQEISCLRRTLELQVSNSERLRIQISALKSLLDSDNVKVRLAMKELERLKQLLHDKEIEKQILEREKVALESDICAVEDRASEISIGWRNCRNELEGTRAAAAVCEHALSLERAACSEVRAQRDQAFARLAMMEADLSHHETLLSEAEATVANLERESQERQKKLEDTNHLLELERQEHAQCSLDRTTLEYRMAMAEDETSSLRDEVASLRDQLATVCAELRTTREQLEWWPRPLTKMLGAARSWLRAPLSMSDAVVWALNPARHGC